METDRISIISLHGSSSNESLQNENDSKKTREGENKTSRLFLFHIFSILAVCAMFLSMITLIPRSNSIIYQTQWFECSLLMAGLNILMAGNDTLNMAIWFNEKSFLSFHILFRMYILYMTTWIVPYISTYSKGAAT